MKDKFSFLNEDPETGHVIFTGQYMEVYIPLNVSDDEKMFEVVGENYRVMGLLNFHVFESENDKKGKRYTLTIPSSIITSPSEIKNEKLNLLDGDEDEEEKHMILQYWSGDIFIHSLEVTQSANEAYKFISMFHAGRVPRAVEYGKLLDLYMSGVSIHGVGLGVPSAIAEIVIAGINRDASSIETPFRKKIGKNPNMNPHSYRPINMKNLPMLNSTFAALSFERINDSIIASVNKAKTDSKEATSPVEKTIRY